MLLHLDFNSQAPIYQQIRNQIVLGIARGSLPEGTKLPSVRALAQESGVNAMTVSKAYQLLKQEGYLDTDRRAGAVIRAPGKNPPDGELLRRLGLCLAELKLAGAGEEEILKLCKRLLEGREKLPW